MTPESKELLVRRYVEEVWNQGRLELADQVISQDHVRHDPLAEGDIVGVDAVKGQIGALRVALPDLHFVALIYPAADGVHVTRRWTMTGTHEGEWMGIRPTGAAISNTGMALSRIEDGKIAEEWIQRDQVGLLRQLGVTTG